jgi:hypothetical protein
MNRRVSVYAACAVLLIAASAPAQSDDQTRIFNAPMDRVWTVARSTLRSLGWDIDKEDHEVGWIRTESRRVEGDDFGVYAKGTKHRLRLVFKKLQGDKTALTVERHVWREERILWMDRDQDLSPTDHRLEQSILDAISASL